MKKSNLLIGILIIGLIAVFVAYKIAYKPHKTIQKQKIEYSGKASDLLPKIQTAPEKWQNNIVAIQPPIFSSDHRNYPNINKTYDNIVKELNHLGVGTKEVGYFNSVQENIDILLESKLLTISPLLDSTTTFIVFTIIDNAKMIISADMTASITPETVPLTPNVSTTLNVVEPVLSSNTYPAP